MYCILSSCITVGYGSEGTFSENGGPVGPVFFGFLGCVSVCVVCGES